MFLRSLLAEFDVGILPFRDVLVGEEVLLGQGLVEFLQHLARVDQGFEPGALDEMLFVALPADAVNEVIIQGSVFIGMLQVQRAGFDPTLNVQEEQRLIERNREFALLLDCCPDRGSRPAQIYRPRRLSL